MVCIPSLPTLRNQMYHLFYSHNNPTTSTSSFLLCRAPIGLLGIQHPPQHSN